MHTSLVVLCAGDNSLHSINSWDKPSLRHFDLCIVYFGSNSCMKSIYKSHSDFFFEVIGPKWKNIYSVLSKIPFWKSYSYIWFPDDDLELDVSLVNDMFDLASIHSISLCQPALVNENVSHSKLITDKHFIGDLKPIDFIEIQMPCFETTVFSDIVLPILRDNQDNFSGWGFDFYWSSCIQNKFLLNRIVARHTKPVQVNSGFYLEFGINPVDEMLRFLTKYKVKLF